MYGKIFASMYDGTLRNNWQALITLQQMIVLCDADGTLEMTPAALAGRTGIPLEVIEAGIRHLEQADPMSRSAAEEGRRIARIDPERSWGWRLVNHLRYRNLQDADQQRAETRRRVREHRERNALQQPVTDGNAGKRHTDTDSNADTEARVKGAGAAAPAPGAPLELLKSDELVGTIPIAGGANFPVTQSLVDELAPLYPAVSIPDEIRKMHAWSLANPTLRKTARGMRRFMHNWLAREQDSARKTGKGVRESSRLSADESYARTQLGSKS